jgi:hypothetical protein
MNANISSILKWWLKKRLRYNLALLFTGLMGFLVQAVQYPLKAYSDEFSRGLLLQMRESGIGLIVFLILANVAFTAGWIIDLIFNYRNSPSFRERLFLIGCGFAITSLIIFIVFFLQLI